MHTPLYYAITNMQYDAFTLLISNGADTTLPFNTDIIYWMVSEYRYDMAGMGDPYYDYHQYIKYLVDRGTDVNYTDGLKWTPLLLSLDYGSSETAKLLIGAGAPATKRNKSRMTAIYLASRRGLTDVVKMLIDAGADVNAAISEGRKPMHIAKKKGYQDTVDLLIASGAK